MKLVPYLALYTKLNSKWVKDLNVWLEAAKLLKETTGGKVLNIGLGNDFLDLTPKEKITKAKINK